MFARARVSSIPGLLIAAFLACGSVAACSGSTNGGTVWDTPGNGHKDGGGGTGDDDDSTGDYDSGPPSGSFGDASTGGGGKGDASCAAQATKAEQLPLDIFIMLDQSASMDETVGTGGSKWTAVTGALNTFLQQPQTNVSVGIQYFGLPPGGGGGTCPTTCTKNADCGPGNLCDTLFGTCICGGGGDSCNAADYSKPDVEIAPLPGVQPAITQSISKHSPSTSTPTSAALQGAIDHASSWASAHTKDVVIALLATDGDPTECDTNLSNINAIAAKGAAGTPKILTFVIGVGSSLGALNGIAAAGGTTNAFIVDTSGNVNQQFLDALNKIRGTALGCTYKIPIPSTGNPDFNNVNVQYTPTGGSAQVIPKVTDKAHCPTSGDAWYYDNNANPTSILLCTTSCGKVTADSTGKVDVLLGCKSVVN